MHVTFSPPLFLHSANMISFRSFSPTKIGSDFSLARWLMLQLNFNIFWSVNHTAWLVVGEIIDFDRRFSLKMSIFNFICFLFNALSLSLSLFAEIDKIQIYCRRQLLSRRKARKWESLFGIMTGSLGFRAMIF